jgi:ribose transport system permease protein
MRKSLGLVGLILALAMLACGWEYWVWLRMPHDAGAAFSSTFLSLANLKNLLPWIGLFGILSLGQSLVIITGGIDLSVGSVVALVGIVAGLLMNKGEGWHPAFVIPVCLSLAAMIGVWHGVLVARLNIQPFVVTLCGLFAYRGVARFLAQDSTQGFGNSYPGLKWFGKGTLLDLFPGLRAAKGEAGATTSAIMDIVSAPFVVMLLIAAALAAYLHFSAQGRHLFALGANEEAARFSGVRTMRIKLQAYLLCSVICGLGGILLAFKVNSMGPSDFGSFYELYAIAGAVLGGCSLRGGTGNVLGVILGIALIMVLRNLVNILSIPSELEYVVIGAAILAGVCADEYLVRRAAARVAWRD